MTISTLDDLYKIELQDAYSACKQACGVTQKLGQAASDKSLNEALIDAVKGIEDGMADLEKLCAEHDINPKAHHCKGMEGLASEAREHALNSSFGDDAVRDAMIISQYQRMAHYAITAYGTLRTFANRLGYDGDGAVLTRMLDSGYDGDRRMTEIATAGVNADAV